MYTILKSNKYRKVFIRVEEFDENGNLVNEVEYPGDFFEILAGSSFENMFRDLPFHIRGQFAAKDLKLMKKISAMKLESGLNLELNFIKNCLTLIDLYGLEFLEKTLDFMKKHKLHLYSFPFNDQKKAHQFNFNDRLNFFCERKNNGIYFSAYTNGGVRIIYEETPTKKQAKYQRLKNDCHIEFMKLPEFKLWKVSEGELN
ncbi:hypothetical protein [Desulfosporosinus sp. FKA]|uniref:hypothetical protein n=1 Tax=Desulfosporosinus sp. FKA TaxID=1969834 RepID=UPI000B49FB02|nr:hypothetical protein [Desulfosporosinus sp. FKA]